MSLVSFPFAFCQLFFSFHKKSETDRVSYMRYVFFKVCVGNEKGFVVINQKVSFHVHAIFEEMLYPGNFGICFFFSLYSYRVLTLSPSICLLKKELLL